MLASEAQQIGALTKGMQWKRLALSLEYDGFESDVLQRIALQYVPKSNCDKH